MLSKTADLFDSAVSLGRKDIKVDAKSALSIVLLDTNFGEIVTIVTQGHDAVPAMAAIERLFQVGFREQPLSMAVSSPSPAPQLYLDADAQ
jgi:phosphotransferase system HPr (HPr) family protein